VGQRKSLDDLFRCYAIPPSPLHQALQEAARQAGWTPPRDHEQQQSQRKAAGKKSGDSRAGLADLRRSLVEIARGRLNPDHRYASYSVAALNALGAEYRNLLTHGDNDPNVIVSSILSVLSPADRKSLRKASRHTLKKDVIAIRKKHGVRPKT
jgi:hypothetical protein